MVVVEYPADMAQYLDKVVGSSDWVEITQEQINKFADATLDHQWIHVDVERAKKEFPGGKTIAHGYLTLALTAGLAQKTYKVEKRTSAVNYGLNKVRFLNQVPVGSRVRGVFRCKAVDPMPNNGHRVTMEVTVEIEGQTKPACVAETMAIMYA